MYWNSGDGYDELRAFPKKMKRNRKDTNLNRCAGTVPIRTLNKNTMSGYPAIEDSNTAYRRSHTCTRRHWIVAT